MSWSCGGKVQSADGVDEIALAWIDQQESAGYAVTDEVKSQIKLAERIAKEIIGSPDAIGAGAEYSVFLSGHANPGHVQTPGYANDMVQVNVSIATYATVEAAPEADEGATNA